MDSANRRDAEAQRLAELTGRIIGICIEVHRGVGPGLLESAYEALVTAALIDAGLKVRSQVPLPIEFKGIKIATGYRIDLIVEDSVIVELKAVERLLPVHEAQLLTYLKLSGLSVGLLINFNVPVLKDGVRRVVNNYPDPSASLRLCGENTPSSEAKSVDSGVANAIPHREPFLFADRIVEQTDTRIVTERLVRAEEPQFKGHYPEFPLMPGVLLCEACFQAGAILLSAVRSSQSEVKDDIGHRTSDTGRLFPMVTRIQDAKFKNPVFPGETIRVEVNVDEKMGNAYLMTGKVTSGDKKVLTVQFMVAMVERPKT